MKNMVSVPKGPMRRYDAPQANIRRSQFNLSRTHKTTFDAGYLIPIFVEETLPGDTFTLKQNSLVRMPQPLDAPVMDDIEMDVHYFWVANRLVWSNWHYFLGEHDAAGAQDTDYTIPIISTTTVNWGGGSFDDLAIYMGIPEGLQTGQVDVSALPFRAYNLIYSTWYRDENLIDEPTLATGNGPDGLDTFPMQKSGKKHDYFTSALPYLQKGSAQSILGTLTTLDVETAAVAGNPVTVVSGSGQRNLDSDASFVDVSASNTGSALTVDMSTIGTVSINTLRESVAIQRLLERDARGGTRPNELIKAHFGVTVPDYRVDRPEYLGGGKGFITVNPIANTSGVDSANSVSGSDEIQGQLYGTAAGTLRASWAKSFVEHGHIIGLLRARAAITYSQGLHRMWSRSTKYDFYWPDLANLGEQPIYNRELWIENDSTDDNVFGYQERYAEYRYGKSLVTGYFAPDVTGAIDHWHLSEDFASQPSLNQTFIEDQSPMDRIKAVTTGPDFSGDFFFDVKAARPMPVRAIPSLVGRF